MVKRLAKSDTVEPLASEPARTPVPEPPMLLRLQQSAGNQAVAALVARSRRPTLARSAITASVGRGGANQPQDVELVQGLLSQAGVANGDVGGSIERYQRETMGWRHPDGRVDPNGKTLHQLSQGGGAAPAAGAATAAPAGGAAPASTTVPGATPPGPTPAGPTPARPAQEIPVGPGGTNPEGAEETFRTFAEGRAPLFAALNSVEEAERRTARQALRAYDAQHLPALRALQQQMGGQWNITDPTARDAVLAAIQLEAACDAEGDLHNNSEEVHKRVAKASGMGLDSAWCGMFTVDHFRHSGMDSELAAGFLHVDNVHDFFTYRHSRNPNRVPRWIWAEHAWHDLHEYHQQRGGERTWLDATQVGQAGDLDIRAGDVVLIDVKRDGTANHIVKASHYDKNTGILLTIGGNDGGFIIDQKGGPATGTGNQATVEAASGERMKAGGFGKGAAGGHVGSSVADVHASGNKPSAVFGVGRPSIVDFEDHRYDRTGNIRKLPAPLKE